MDREGGGQTLPLIRLLIHLNMEFLLCYLYPSQSWSQGPFWRLWVDWWGGLSAQELLSTACHDLLLLRCGWLC